MPLRTTLAPLLLVSIALGLLLGTAAADDWPEWMGRGRTGHWRETGIIDRFPAEGPRIVWRQKISGGYSGPAVAAGKVYLTDFQTPADVSALSAPQSRPKIAGKERVICLDAASGDELWQHAYDCTYEIAYPAGPRCTPTVVDGKVYSLGSQGHLFCLDAAKGKVIWSKEFSRDFKSKTPIWGFCGHPLVDGNKLFCMVGGAKGIVYAFDKDTGRELWHAIDAPDPGYSAPVIIEAGGTRQLVVWEPKAVHGLDPETGRIHWSAPLEPLYGMSIMIPRRHGDHLFIGGMGQSLTLKLAADKPAVEEVWRGTTTSGVGPVNMTPFLENDLIFGVDQPGALRAVDLHSGKRLWETYEPLTGQVKSNRIDSGTAFLVKNGERFFIASETGELIIARLDRAGYHEASRWKLLEPTHPCFGRTVLWSHPAFANKCVFWRNNKEIVCASLAAQ
jgi:outer membrane protein assembly factor BamB